MPERPQDTKTIRSILEPGVVNNGHAMFFRFALANGEIITLETNANGIIEVIKCLQAIWKQAQQIRQKTGHLLPLDHPELLADYLDSTDFLLAEDGQSALFLGTTTMGRDVQFELTKSGVQQLEKALAVTRQDLAQLGKRADPGRLN